MHLRILETLTFCLCTAVMYSVSLTSSGRVNLGLGPLSPWKGSGVLSSVVCGLLRGVPNLDWLTHSMFVCSTLFVFVWWRGCSANLCLVVACCSLDLGGTSKLGVACSCLCDAVVLTCSNCLLLLVDLQSASPKGGSKASVLCIFNREPTTDCCGPVTLAWEGSETWGSGMKLGWTRAAFAVLFRCWSWMCQFSFTDPVMWPISDLGTSTRMCLLRCPCWTVPGAVAGGFTVAFSLQTVLDNCCDWLGLITPCCEWSCVCPLLEFVDVWLGSKTSLSTWLEWYVVFGCRPDGVGTGGDWMIFLLPCSCCFRAWIFLLVAASFSSSCFSICDTFSFSICSCTYVW